MAWFRNWGTLKSVRSVEHFHVLLREPKEGLVEKWTGGKKALCDAVSKTDGSDPTLASQGSDQGHS